MSERLGYARMQPLLEEYLRVGQTLIGQNKGRYIKNIGDAHMATFEDLDAALRFAAEFQQYYQEQPYFEREQFVVRVALALGGVVETAGDAFGRAIIEAARIESKTEGGYVILNSSMKDEVEKAWGNEKTAQYFQLNGEFELKGIKEKHKLYEFRWGPYAKTYPEKTLAARLMESLECVEIVPTNLNAADLGTAGTVIWPVVPRGIATAVHRAQIEVIRLLALFGWKPTVVIADCGTGMNLNKDEVDKFALAIEQHAKYRNIRGLEITYLSSYFRPENESHADVLERFRKITSEMKIQDLIYLNQKSYDGAAKQQIIQEPTLDFLRPILTCAAVVHLASHACEADADKKAIIVAGLDEQPQWQSILSMGDAGKNMAAILNPVFTIRDGGASHTARQKNDWPIWRAKKELEDDMQSTNAAKWVVQLHAQLPSFPALSADIGGQSVSGREWRNEFTIPKKLDSSKIVDAVWHILDPTRHMQ
jgi:hypothetical protein